jgi:hypothetical protein
MMVPGVPLQEQGDPLGCADAIQIEAPVEHFEL